jgi:hypothetical protein
MRIDISFDVDRATAAALTTDYMKECLALAVSAIADGHAKGTGLHPGITVEWEVIRDEDAL